MCVNARKDNVDKVATRHANGPNANKIDPLGRGAAYANPLANLTIICIEGKHDTLLYGFP